MNRIPVRIKIVLGLQLLVISAMGLAVVLGIGPNEEAAALKARANLSEMIAVDAAAFIARNDLQGLDAILQATVDRNADIQRLVVRKQNGFAVIDTGSGQTASKAHEAGDNGSARASVPIWANNARWGSVEVEYRPLRHSGPLGFFLSSNMKMILFVAVVSFLSFTAYIKRMLRYLDPSKVVPPHVRAALDTLAEGLLILDQDFQIALANRSFANVVGKDPEKLMGLPASTFCWEQQSAEGCVKAALLPWETAIQQNQAQHNCTLLLSDSQGVKRTFIVNCSPVAGARGKPRGALVSFEDVTLLMEKEIELRKSKEAADEANRAKSDFLARMSHEIRTPMNAVLGLTEILRRGYENSQEERLEFLDTIHSSGQHLLELINDILDLSKIESGKLEIELLRCSPHEIISGVVATLGMRAESKGIKLTFAWDGLAPATILTDPTRLRQVITNLVGNAIKFTETGGVHLLARLDQSAERPKLVVDVIDTGIGMKPEALQRIFDPFSQADTSISRRFGGTGLGLSISRQCAAALGGGLSVKSEYGKGSVFSLSVDAGPAETIVMVDPLAQQSARAGAKDSANPTVRLKPANILVVEDGTSNQKLITIVVQRAGAKVELANNGLIGVEKALAGKYDAILMDMQMPVMDGFTATRQLREKGCTLPIVALTANAMKGEEEKCRAAGCSGYLSKPIDIDLLLRTLAEIVGELPAENPAASQPGDSRPAPDSKANQLPRSTSKLPPRLESTLPTQDPEFLEIVQEFVDRVQQQLGEMQKAWERQELSQLASLAHWLKGSGGTAGFNAFTAPAAKLEKSAKEKRLEEIAAALADVQDLGRRLVRPNAEGGVKPAESR